MGELRITWTDTHWSAFVWTCTTAQETTKQLFAVRTKTKSHGFLAYINQIAIELRIARRHILYSLDFGLPALVKPIPYQGCWWHDQTDLTMLHITR
ncbi:hypothetical protein VTK73DRAFT_4654 [Phialemonium thermophilum]|uniref:Uncharacterized protein n=1 Tax=Phialemonium thermophilum TaxID=223376 RepID=A0ABR3WSF0_9PEZI